MEPFENEIVEPKEDQREGYTLKSDRHAQWAFDRLRAYQREMDRLKAAATQRRARLAENEVYQEVCAELSQLDEWEADVMHGPQRSIQWFENLLADYVAILADTDPDLPKTYKLPNGEISRRKLPDRIEIDNEIADGDGLTDEDAFVNWCIDGGHFQLLKITPRLDAIKSLVDLSLTGPPEDSGRIGVVGIDLNTKGNPTRPGQRGQLVDASAEVIPGVYYVVGENRIGKPKVL